MIIVIGLVLAPVGVNMALGKAGDGSAVLVPENTALIISMAALATTVLVSLLGRGMIRLIPIMSGIAVGYLCAIGLGIHDFSKVAAAPWFGVPDFVFPEFRWEAILFIIPITLAPAIEHFGDIIAISSVTGKDFLKDPGIKSTMLGDGIATMLASFIGGPPNTTYSEVTGAVALTRAFNPGVMTWAAIWAIVLSCVNKLGAFLSSIPVPVMGGIMILLFGAIMVVGLNTLVRAGEDLMEPRNLAVVALIIIFGVGGMTFNIGSFRLGRHRACRRHRGAVESLPSQSGSCPQESEVRIARMEAGEGCPATAFLPVFLHNRFRAAGMPADWPLISDIPPRKLLL